MHTNYVPRTCPDQVLVQRALADDQRAYSELMRRYEKWIYFNIRKMVPDHEDAADLTQETFFKAFRRLDSYHHKYAFSTWIHRIAVNTCIDFIRKKRLDTRSLDAPLNEDEDGTDFHYFTQCSQDTPEEAVIRKQRHQAVREMVQLLREKYRRMVELRYFRELSYEEIATELDLPVGTVKAQLFRARSTLARHMLRSGMRAAV